MRHDILEVSFLSGASVQTVKVKRGTLEVAPGHLSYVGFDDETGARTYVPLHRLDRFRYFDQSRATA
jgi:hypothetical protein